MAKPQKLYQFNLHKDARRCEYQLAHYLQKTELKTFFFEQILYFHFSKMLLFNLCLVEIGFFYPLCKQRWMVLDFVTDTFILHLFFVTLSGATEDFIICLSWNLWMKGSNSIRFASKNPRHKILEAFKLNTVSN